MPRLKFYLSKANMLAHFIWWRDWQLVRDEWDMTYAQWKDADDRSDEICREAAERLMKAIEEGAGALRAERLRDLHRMSPSESAYVVQVPRRLLLFFTGYNRVYLTVCQSTNHWFVMVTNREDGHNRAGGTSAYAADFRIDDGEVYQRPGLSGAWKSALTMWSVKDEDEAAEIVEYIALMVHLAHQQHVGV